MKSVNKRDQDKLARFQRASDESRHRLIGASSGEVGSGKTYFWMTARNPVVFFSLDLGLEGVVDPYLQKNPKKEIRVWEREWMPTEETSQEEAITLRDEFLADFEYAVQNVGNGTVVLDKETQFWELFRYAEFGAPNDAPRNYPALNQRFSRVINIVKATDANAGFIQAMSDEWVTVKKREGGTKGQFSGNRQRDGFKKLAELVHLDLFHRRDEGDMWVDVKKSRGPGAMDVQDQSYLASETPFADLAVLIFPETSQEDWE